MPVCLASADQVTQNNNSWFANWLKLATGQSTQKKLIYDLVAVCMASVDQFTEDKISSMANWLKLASGYSTQDKKFADKRAGWRLNDISWSIPRGQEQLIGGLVAMHGIHWQNNPRTRKKQLIYELIAVQYAWHQLIKSHRTITADSRIDWNLPLGNQRKKSWFTIWLQFAWHQLIKSQRTRTADWRTGCSLHGLLPFQGGDMVQSIGGETCYNGKLKNKKWNYK